MIPAPTHEYNEHRKRCWQLLNICEATSFNDTGTSIDILRSGTENSTIRDGNTHR